TIEDCLKILLEQKKREIDEIEKKVTKLSKKLEEIQKNTFQEQPQFLFIHEKGKFLQKTKKLITQSQTSIEVLTTQDRFQHITYFLDEEIKKALQRGVKFRVILEKEDAENPLPENIKILKHSALFIVKYIHVPLRRVLSIIDNKEVFIVTSQLTKLEEATTLWTNNDVIREIIREYFESLWTSAELIN
ncbi:MAG: TrmB family transcriptional regulator sugar-binding domain-containing protein, partial [Candidatus Bathyarchaeia archaeon]